MSTRRFLGVSLLVWAWAGGRLFAADPAGTDRSVDERSVIKVVSANRAESLRDTDDAPSPQRPEVIPLPVGARPVEVVATAGRRLSAAAPGTVAADASERLVYSNTLGTFVLPLRANYLVADDLSLNAPPGCNLRRYSFQVSLKADPNGLAGPVTARFALYDTCPQAGGQIVPGTSGAVTFSGAWVDSAPLTTIVVLIPEGFEVPLPATAWLGVRFDRDNAGVVLGAPALAGFSDDAFDFPLIRCRAGVGGFPQFPHGSFNAEVYVDSACPRAFLSYRNIQPGAPGKDFGAGVRFADDIELQDESCELVGYEVGVQGLASYSVDLRQDRGGLPGDVIAGTPMNFLASDSSAKIQYVPIDPPIHLVGSRNRVWLSVRANTWTGGWIRTGLDGTLGHTDATVAVETQPGSGRWELRAETDHNDPVYSGYYATLICQGDPPLGACCDMHVTQCKGGPDDGAPCYGTLHPCREGGTCESACREVAEMNCAFRPGAKPLEPQWVEGAACDPDPFPHACGLAACCTPDDTCENLTRNECYALEPVELHRQWQLGQYCDEGYQDCPFNACLQRQGECLLPHEPPGCRDPDCCASVCAADPFCCRVEWDRVCVALASDGRCAGIQMPNDECAPTNRQQGAIPLAIPSSTLALSERATRNIADDPGLCCHQGFRVCSGGCRNGLQCMIDDDCTGAQPGTCVNSNCNGGCRSGQFCGSDTNCQGAPVGTCVLPPEPNPGEPIYGTHWYSFTIPPASSPEDPETISLRIDTCETPGDPDNWDSLVEVFSIADSDRGTCIGLGRCNDLTLCRVADNDPCADGSTCRVAPILCSLAADDCPLDTLCEFDLEAACDRTRSLAVIGCNDDALDGCGEPLNKGRLSKLCLSDLERGNTYLVMVGGKREKDIRQSPPGNVVDYRLRLTQVPGCTVRQGGDPLANDYCRAATPLPFDATHEIVRDFDLTDASWDCEPRDLQCASMRNDIWYEYRPSFSGTVTFEACGPDNPSTPNVCLAVYDGCECPPTVGPSLTCGCLNLGNSTCQVGAKEEVDVLGGACYKVRLTDDRGVRGEGTLSIRFEQGDCNGNGTPDNCEVSCGMAGDPCFGVPGCGTADDCNGNVIPDACDILIAYGGLCDPDVRDDCSDDADGDGLPDECAPEPGPDRGESRPPDRPAAIPATAPGFDDDPCCGAEGSCLLPHTEPGCEDPMCCADVCEADAFCCLSEWDRACVILAAERCTWLTAENDRCAPSGGLEGATLVKVPGSAITPGWLAATDPSEPGFCCHRGPDRFCTGSSSDIPCFSDMDCPNRSCPPGEPRPGATGFGTVWYTFVATHTSAELTLEFSEFPVTRTLLQVFDVGDPTNPKTACQSLTPIACLDAAAGGPHSGSDRPSALCVRDLVPGRVYYAAAAAKTEEDLGLYRLTIDAPCAPQRRLLNDTCHHAAPLAGKVAFNLEDAIIECPTSDCGGPLHRDVWFDYVAPQDGTVELSACSLDLLPGQRPWTVIVREGCECDDESRPIVLCAHVGDELCRSNSSVSFETRAGQCYKIRLGARSLSAPNGELCVNCRHCPRATVRWDRPILGGFEDMRRPFDPEHPEVLEGISLLAVQASEDADDACWSLCETSLNPGLHPQYPPGMEQNGISVIENVDDDEYVIHFKRPLTPGEQTTVTYTDDYGTASRALFIVHPGEVNGDGVADGNDLLAFAEGLRKWCFGPRLCLDGRDYWPYIVDMNRDDRLTAQDLLELVDLLVGAGPYEPWLGSVVPFESVECP